LIIAEAHVDLATLTRPSNWAGTLILREGKYSQELIEIFKAKKLTA